MILIAVSVGLLLTLVERSSSSSNSPNSYRSGKLQYGNFVKHEHKILSADVALEVHKVPKASACGLKCTDNERCTSYNVASTADSNGKLKCELLDITKYTRPAALKYSAAFNHYELPVRITRMMRQFSSIHHKLPILTGFSVQSDLGIVKSYRKFVYFRVIKKKTSGLRS